MATVDLDAARVARAEARGEGPTVTLGGQEFKLPSEVFIESAVALREGDVITFAKTLLEDQWEAFAEAKPTLDDCWAIVNSLGELYAAKEGNSSASNGSSRKSGSRSRPTSRVPTA